jgi:8-amino-7-oxononanoate synthase
MAEQGSAAFEDFLERELAATASAGLMRRLAEGSGSQVPRAVRGGRRVVKFSSNDYLGLASHPALREAAMREWERGGFGAGSSRLICGTLEAHLELEEALATFKGTEAALSFGSGYAAATGTIPALCGKDDVIILDKLCHACLIDGARLSGASIRVFPHNDIGRLEAHLRWAARTRPSARVLIVAESVYSMDGDTAPLRDILDVKERHGAWLLLDEAHGVGVLGPGGRGTASEDWAAGRIEVLMGTLGKALGAHGAYIAGSRRLRELLVNRARTFIFSTAPPPPVAAAARCAIGIVTSDEGRDLMTGLRANIGFLCEALGLAEESPAAIIPLVIGAEQDAVEASSALMRAGFYVPGIRFPTVPRGKARLRFTVTASHFAGDIAKLGAAVADAGLRG